MKTNIYGLVHPDTKQVVYVGKTTNSIENRLKAHYWKYNEVLRGKRNYTKLFRYIEELLPKKLEIILLKEVIPSNGFNLSNFYESFYIKKYREINPNLLNETDGGDGGYTYSCKSKEEIKRINDKISKSLKGRTFGKQPKKSLSKKGTKNPAARKLDKPIFCFKCGKLITKIEYLFEINDLVGSKYAAGNVAKQLKTKVSCSAGEYDFIKSIV